MARDDAPDPNGPETFDRLKARLGRFPTAEELSRELLTVRIRRGHSPDKVSRRRRARAFAIVGVGGLLSIALLFVAEQRPGVRQVLSPDLAVPPLPPAPAIETAVALPDPATDIPPAPPPAEDAPTRRLARAAAPAPAPNPPVSPLPGDAAIERRVLPDIPASARRTITGRVRINIRVSVDPSGNVIDASSASPGASRYFTGLAERAAREWKFAAASPDRADGAREWVIRFELGRQATTAAAVPAVP